jgi:hypothetical protein
MKEVNDTGIGFDWLYFPKVVGMTHFNNPFANSSLHSFGLF